MGEFGANGINESTKIRAEDKPDIDTYVPNAPKVEQAPEIPEETIEPLETAINTLPELDTSSLENFAESWANQSPDEAMKMFGALKREIYETFGIAENNPDALDLDAQSRIEALAEAVQSNQPEEIEQAISSLFDGAIDSPERLNELAGLIMGQGGGNFEGLSIGGKNPLSEEQLKARRDRERADNAAAIDGATKAALDAFVDNLFDNVADVIWNNVAVQAAAKSFNDIIANAPPGAPPSDAAMDAAQDGIETTIDAGLAAAEDDPEVAVDIEGSTPDELADWAAERFKEAALRQSIEEFRAENPNATEEELQAHIDRVTPEIDATVDAAMADPVRRQQIIEHAQEAAEKHDLTLASGTSFTTANFQKFLGAGITALTGFIDEKAQEYDPEAYFQTQIDEANDRLDDAQRWLENVNAMYDDPDAMIDTFFIDSLHWEAVQQVQTEEDYIEYLESQRDVELFFQQELAESGEALTLEGLKGIIMDVDPELFRKNVELTAKITKEDFDPEAVFANMAGELPPEQQAELGSLMEFAKDVTEAKIALLEAREWHDSELKKAEYAREMDPDNVGFTADPMMGGGVAGTIPMMPAQNGAYLGDAMDAEKAALKTLAELRAGSPLEGEALEQAIIQESVLQTAAGKNEITQSDINQSFSYLGLYGEKLDNAQNMIGEFLQNQHGISVIADVPPKMDSDSIVNVAADAPAPAPTEISPDDIEEQLIIEITERQQLDSISKEEIMNMLADEGLNGEQLAASTEQVIADLQTDIGIDFVTGLNWPSDYADAVYGPDHTIEEEPEEPVVVANNEGPAPKEQDYAYNTSPGAGPA